MKRKLLSGILSLVLIFTMVYMGIPTVLAENENLIINGDFSSYSGNTPTGWRFDPPATNSFSYEIVKNVQIPNGPKTNAIKFTSSETVEKLSGGIYQPLDSSGREARMFFSSTNTAKIEKSATYTMTFWVKVKSIYGFSALMFEPDYVIPSLRRGLKYALEGHNLYTYKTGSSSLRNCRDDINHVWKVVSSGEQLSNYPSSMFITRNNIYGDSLRNYQQVLTPDFPSDQNEGEWLQVSQTFKTDNIDAHEADVAYTFRFPQVAGGEVWIADVQLTVQKQEALFYYTPTVNDETLGTVSKDVPVYDEKSVVIKAEAFEGNTFEGWYLNGELISEDEEYTFTYKNGDVIPNYEARFHKGIGYKITPPGVNDYNLGFVSPTNSAYAYEGEEVIFTATPLDGNGFDGWYKGDQLISDSLIYTKVYDPQNTDDFNITAKFVPGPYAIPGAGFEGLGYTNNQVLVTHTNGYIAANGETCDQSDLTNNGDWSVDSIHEGTWRQVIVDTNFAHTGTTSVRLDCRLGWGGYTIKGLQPYSNYSVSFYAWAFDNKGATINGLNQVLVTNAGERPIHKTISGWTNRNYTNALGAIRSVVDCREGWTKLTGSFKTTDKGDVTVWFNVTGDGTHNLHIDNIAVFEPVEVTVAQTLGGTIKTNLSNNNDVPAGSRVELKAFPLEGNSFDGWYNSKTNELISSNLSYNFNVSGPISLIAKFSGDNMPPTDILPLQGMDGTFENGRIDGWWADDPVWGQDVSWCRWERSTEMAYEGSYSLRSNCRYRYTNLTFNNLAKNTDYCLTMYVNPTGAAEYDQTEDYTRIEEYGIIGPDERYLEGATDVLVRQGTLKGNQGWQRLDLCFNTGDRTSVTFSAKLIGNTGTVCYYDNISLYQNAAETIKTPGNVNGDENGDVTLDDVVALAQIVAGWKDVQHSKPHLDINGDLTVSLDDVVLLAQYVAGWDVELSEIAYKP